MCAQIIERVPLSEHSLRSRMAGFANRASELAGVRKRARSRASRKPCCLAAAWLADFRGRSGAMSLGTADFLGRASLFRSQRLSGLSGLDGAGERAGGPFDRAAGRAGRAAGCYVITSRCLDTPCRARG